MNKSFLILFFLVILIVQTVGATTVTSFTAAPTSGTAPLMVQFTDTSTGTPVEWQWDFGDYQGSNMQNPTHVYYKGGHTFNVRLRTFGADGKGNYSTQTTITVNALSSSTFPTPSFTMIPTSGKVPLTVQFHGTSTEVVDRWWWNGFAQSPDLMTKQDTTYTFTTGDACSNLEMGVPISVDAFNDSPIYGDDPPIVRSPIQYLKLQIDPQPVTSFTALPTSGHAPLTVYFADTSSNTPNRWGWDFGDGFKSNYGDSTQYRQVLHTYTISGVYTVTHTGGSSTSCGPLNTVSTTITVLSPLDPNAANTSPTLTPTETTTTTTSAAPDATITTTTIPKPTITITKDVADIIITENIAPIEPTDTTQKPARPTSIQSTKKIPTSLPTDTPTEPSPMGMEAGIMATIGAALLVMRRR